MYPLYWTSSKEGKFMRYTFEFKKKCVKLFKQGRWPDEIPEGVTEAAFKQRIREWARLEKVHGMDVLRHKIHNTKYTADQKLALVNRVLAGKSVRSVAAETGIENTQLRAWVNKYINEGYNGLIGMKKGRPRKYTMKEKPTPLTETEREELIRLREENEYIKTENAFIKKLSALRQEKAAAQLRAKKQPSSKISEKKDIL